MILIVDTTQSHAGKVLCERLHEDFELLDTTQMKISPCLGCNYCWLKTPGQCTIKDDQENILRKAIHADRLWLVADTQFGFISYRGKNILDRLIPLTTMNLHFIDGEMRHIPRYDKLPDLGIVYCGNGDKEYLERWCKRAAINLSVRSLGAHEIQEAASCIW